MHNLAVVLISKNQEWNMARLLRSVLGETAQFAATEVVLVDSASSDATTAIASHFPIRVLRLRPDQQLSAAAGRYVGYRHSAGELVLFLDGDMVLCSGFLPRATQVLQTRPDIAVIGGQILDVPKAALSASDQISQGACKVTEVRYCPGAALYRRSVLDRVGSFNPFFYSDEEPELCLRIRHAGYKVAMLDCPMVYHYSDPAEAIFTVIGRWRRKLYLGTGQSIRYHLRTGLLWAYLRERGYGIAPALAILVGALSFALSVWTDESLWFGSWAVAVAAIVGVYAWRKRSLSRTCASLLKRLAIVDGTIRGFLMKPLDPASYSAKLDVVR
ncbi:MAG TPA: glycosyltransferase [Terriglobales bacterium]|nr:glycosyltransferase [Terriglobales bacterium]